eukprot:12065284-Alexandrium_andersonii.AAC.1
MIPLIVLEAPREGLVPPAAPNLILSGAGGGRCPGGSDLGEGYLACSAHSAFGLPPLDCGPPAP